MTKQQQLIPGSDSDQNSSAEEAAPTPTVTVLPAQDVFDTLDSINGRVTVTILDPWYNKGFGGVRDDYDEWLFELVAKAAQKSDHVFIWGFSEIIHKVLENIPDDFKFVEWLVWYYKNCPSVIRGWRSAHNSCIHICREDAKLYPEHFLNEKQLEKLKEGKLRYIPGPTNVIECALNIGFIGRKEQTGHPSQKPLKVFEQIIKMTTVPGDSVLDPMCGGGTAGVASYNWGVDSILCDMSEEYLGLSKTRLEELEIEYQSSHEKYVTKKS